MSSSLGTPTFSSPTPTSSQMASASPSIETEAAKTIAWQAALYLMVVFVIVVVVAIIIIRVGRVDWTIPTIWREKMDSRSPTSSHMTFHLPSAFMLIETMMTFFSTTFLPAFQRLRTATTSSIGAFSRPQPILPQFAAPSGLPQPLLTPPCPVVPRDNLSRVPSNPYIGSSALPSPVAH